MADSVSSCSVPVDKDALLRFSSIRCRGSFLRVLSSLTSKVSRSGLASKPSSTTVRIAKTMGRLGRLAIL